MGVLAQPLDMNTHIETLTSSPISGLSGEMLIPGDKSISHRALILGGMAIGQTKVSGLLMGADVLSTLEAVRALGVNITSDADIITIDGVGTGGFIPPHAPLDLGNAGTGVRLLMGAVAGQPISATFTGDASLSKRPMRRITDPLALMGAQIAYTPEGDEKGYLPVTITGAQPSLPLTYEMPVASAQIKSAILFASLNARGKTIVTEPHLSRDHSEAMLSHFGVELTREMLEDGRHRITLEGEGDLHAKDIFVPRDPSSAAFAIVAALITDESHITLPGISLNPQRTGLITTLQEMGGNIVIENKRIEGGEDVGDIIVRSSQLSGIEVPAERAASMIDEYPILSVAASRAQGKTYMPGVAELRVKETDRISVMAEGLKACGVEVSETNDSMTVIGGSPIKGGAKIASQHDHRIAMSFLVLGMVAQNPVTMLDVATISTSFPDFAAIMNKSGAQLEAGGELEN